MSFAIINIFTITKYSHTYGPSSAFTGLMWPMYTYASSALSACAAGPTCIAGQASTAVVTNLPTVSSCYTGTGLTATTLTSQAKTTCATSRFFCRVILNVTRNLKEVFAFSFKLRTKRQISH